MNTITLEEAKQQGLTRYYTGIVCVRGHIAERYVNGRHQCVECKAESEKRWYDNHKQEILEYRTKLRSNPHHKQKQSKKAQEWREKNPETVKAYQEKWYKDHPNYHNECRINPDKRPGRMLAEAKGRAKRANMEFNITHEDIIIPEFCPILNIPLVLTNTKMCDNSPSLDRIDNTKGYIKGNVCVISMRANALKSDGSIKDFEAILHYMKQLTS